MKILIVSEYIAPVKSIAAIRWTKLGKYLSKDHGCEVDILTNEKSFDPSNLTTALYEKDEALAEDLAYFNKVYTFSDGLGIKLLNVAVNGAKAAYRFMVGRSGKKAEKQAAKQSEPTDATASAGAPENKDTAKSNNNALPSLGGASFFANAYDRYMDIRSSLLSKRAHTSGVNWDDYDVVISTYGPKWPHMMVDRQKKKGLDAVWIADYRDTVIRSIRSANKRNKEFPNRYSGSADVVLAINEPLIETLGLSQEQQTSSLSNGFDASDNGKEAATKDDNAEEKFIITYTGSLYNDQEAYSDLTPIFEALDTLILENRIDADDIEFIYCGTSEAQFTQQASGYSSFRYRNLGSLARKDALAIQKQSSILVLCLWNNPNFLGNLGGKFFEYLSSGTPIAATCTGSVPNSMCGKMLAESGAGFCYEEVKDSEHFEKLVEFIASNYQQWKETGQTSYVPDESYINSFRYDHLAEKLHSIMTQTRAAESCTSLGADLPRIRESIPPS